MELKNLLGLWTVLTTFGETTVSVLAGSLIHCNVPSVMAGQGTSLTCYFNQDMGKTDFLVQHNNRKGQLSEVLSCLWITTDRPTCTTRNGYNFDGKINSNVTATIPSATEQHVGSYMCLVVPSDLSDSRPCNFTLKETGSVTEETSPSPTVYSVPTTEQKSIITEQEDNNVNVIAIVMPLVLITVLISAVIIIYMYRSRISARFRNCKIRKQTARRCPVEDERDDKEHVESHPLVGNTETELSQVETMAAKLCDLTHEEVITKFGQYIYNRAVQLLRKTGAVVITGPERCGKSTLGRAVLDHFSEKGFYPLILNHPNRWWKEKQGNRKHVVLLDECKVDEWSRETVQSMLRDDQCSVIFVLRSDVLNSQCIDLAALHTAPTVVLGNKVPTDTESTKQLFEACQSDDVEQVVALLSGGLDPNWLDDEDKRPLHIACEHGQADIVSNLLWAGSSVDVIDTKGRTPLHYACGAISRSVQHDSSISGSVQARRATSITTHDNDEQYDSPRESIVKSLLAYGADVNAEDKDNGRTPLHTACEYGSNSLVRILLNAGARVEAKDKRDHTPLHVACKHNSHNVAKSLLDAKADVYAKDKNGLTPLHVACEHNSLNVAKSLLDAKADVYAKDKNGLTPLHVACKYNHQNITKSLLDAKSDVEARDKHGLTPLHSACVMQAKDSAKVLLRANASVQAMTNTGRTPLHMACERGSIEIVQMLLDKGAKIGAKDQKEDTPLSLAERKEHHRIRAMLVKK